MKGLGKNHLFNQMWIHEIKSFIHKLTLHVDIVLLQHKLKRGNLGKRL